MIKISKRLLAISNFVNDNSSVIDVGCDHGLLSIYLYLNKKGIKIIASDINKNALKNAIDNIKKYNLENNIKTIISDGLENIDMNGIDTVIISGMGTNTIIGILTKCNSKLNKVDNLIISSNNKQELLRKIVTSIGFIIDKELLIEEKGIIYTIIRFTKGSKKYSKKEYKYGPLLLNNKDSIFVKSIDKDIKKKQEILDNIPRYKVYLRIKIRLDIYRLKKIIK